ncbi:hypothetical protein SAMN05216390_11252 [Lachnospiraceae bacterium KH1T2]|nr:hypothetical protein SAMN05216390_11252 [Lachnospiraceae bacterium KH1T2]
MNRRDTKLLELIGEAKLEAENLVQSEYKAETDGTTQGIRFIAELQETVNELDRLRHKIEEAEYIR